MFQTDINANGIFVIKCLIAGHFSMVDLPHFILIKNCVKICTSVLGTQETASVSVTVTSPFGRRNLKQISRHYWFIKSLVLMSFNILGISMNLCN